MCIALSYTAYVQQHVTSCSAAHQEPSSTPAYCCCGSCGSCSGCTTAVGPWPAGSIGAVEAAAVELVRSADACAPEPFEPACIATAAVAAVAAMAMDALLPGPPLTPPLALPPAADAGVPDDGPPESMKLLAVLILCGNNINNNIHNNNNINLSGAPQPECARQPHPVAPCHVCDVSGKVADRLWRKD